VPWPPRRRWPHRRPAARVRRYDSANLPSRGLPAPGRRGTPTGLRSAPLEAAAVGTMARRLPVGPAETRSNGPMLHRQACAEQKRAHRSDEAVVAGFSPCVSSVCVAGQAHEMKCVSAATGSVNCGLIPGR
jgi:hypothetical protein